MIEQGTNAWFAMRAGKVTASRVADILAKTKTGAAASRQNYLIQLAIEQVTGVVEPSFQSEAMLWGVEQEQLARTAYEVKTGNFVDQIAFIDHPTIQGFGASPDGLIDANGMVEIKNPNSATHWQYIKDNAPPRKYWIQQQAQLACAEREWNDFVSFDSRMPERSQLLIVRVFRDDKFIAEMEAEVQKFLSEVEVEVQLMKGSSYGS